MACAGQFEALTKLELAGARRPYGAILRWVIAYATAETPAMHDELGAHTAAARSATAEALALAPYWPELAAFVAGSRERAYRT